MKSKAGINSNPTPSNTYVSIHAPTRGATLLFQDLRTSLISFNPRAHAGRDFTPTCEYTQKESFNPRAHAGRDDSQEPQTTT